MWGKVLFFTFVTVLAVTQGTLLDMLKTIHANPSFKNLAAAEQVLIIEMIAEIEAGELKAYIDEVGFHHVIAVIDKLPADEAHSLTQLLVKELQIEEGKVNATMVVGKRDLVSMLNQVMANQAFQTMPVSDQNTIKQIITAAENNTLTSYIQSVGYSTILPLMDALPQHEGHMFATYLFQHLHSEMGH